jgi:hypothetical protein
VQVLAVHGGELGRIRGVDADDAEPAGAHAGELPPRAVAVRGGLLQPGAHFHRVTVQVLPVAGPSHLGARPRLPQRDDQLPAGAPGAHRTLPLLRRP